MATRNFNVKNGLTAGNITLDASTNTTTTSNLVATGNVSFTGSNVSLGSVSNVKITGGTGGYVLSTDGSGNLSWIATTATLAGAYVFTQSTPATTWVVNHNLGVQYVNVQVIDANGVSYTGRYNYPTITFNNAAALTITFDSAVSGYAAVTSGGGQQNVGGSNTQIQFNDANVLGGSAAFTFNKTSNLVSMGGALSVTGNANVGNLGTARVIATGNISGTQLISNVATGTAPFVVTSTTQVANLNVATAGTAGSATTAGTVTTAAQPNITSVGTLTGLTVNGNVTLNNTASVLNANSASDALRINQIGTGNALVVEDAANPDSTPFVVSSDGNVSIGGTTPTNKLQVVIPDSAALGQGIELNTVGNTGYFRITGGWSGGFLPAFAGKASNNSGSFGYGMLFNGLSGNASDTGNGVITFSARDNAGTANVGSTQTAFSFRNYVSNLMVIMGSGNVGMGGNIAPAHTVSINGTLNASGNANVGNIGATNGVFTNVSGNGSALSSITGGNVTGAVAFATTANSVAGANVSGQVANSLVAGTVYTNAQPNITSVGTLTGLTANGNVTINQNAAEILTIAARQAPTTDMVNVTNAGQAVVTSGVSGIQLTYVGGAAAVEASAYRTDLTPGTTTGGTWNGFRMVAASNAASGVTMNAIKIDNITGGAGTENMIYAGTGWDNILNYNGTSVIYGNGKVNGAEVVGTVANATYATSAGTATSATSATSATTAGTVTTAAQPNITSVGTLTSLGVNGTVTASAFTANTGVFTGNGAALTNLNASNISSGTLAQARLANSSLTVNGTAISLGGSGTITANTTQTLSNGSYITGDSFNGGTARTWAVDATTTNTANKVVARDANGSFSANIITATLSGSATTAGTVTTAAQPNITSVGTLTSLSVTGNVAAGNLTTTGVLSVTGTGVSSIAGNLDMTGNTIINLATPTNSTDAATKQYVDDVAQGLHTHDACQAATPDTLANISGGTVTYNNGTSGVGATLTTTGSYTTIDGVTLTNGMRILVKNEANTAHNGIYDRTSATVLTRSTDFDTSTEMAGGDFTFVQAGTLYDNTGWVMPDSVTTVGTSPVVWVQFSGAGTYTAGTGLTLTGTQFSVNASQTQVTSVGTLTGLNVNGTVTASAFTANTGVFTGNGAALTNLNASNISSGTLAQARLANSSLTVNGTAISLGGSGTITANTTQTLSNGSYITGDSFNGGTARTWAVDATTTNTASKVVARDANGSFSANIITATLSGSATSAGSATTAGTVTTAAQPNITSVGTLTSLGVSGAVTASTLVSNVATGTAPLTVTSTTKVANLNVEQVDGYHADITSTANNIVVRDANANIFGNNFTGRTFTSNVATGTAPFVVTSTTQVANLNVANAGYATSAGSATTATSATTAGTVTTAAQPNITSVGTLTGLTANGNVTINQNAAEILTIAASQPPTSDMVVITNTGQNVATSGVSGLQVTYVGGAGAIEASAYRSDMTPGTTSGSTWNAFRVAATTAAASGVVFNGMKFDNKSTGAGTSRAFYVGTGYDEILNYNGTVVINGNGTVNASQVTGTVSSATTAGTVTTAAQPNITSVGTLTSLTVTGNITAGNLSAGAGGTVSGNLLSVATGNITTINSGLMQNGNSNVTITANGNVTLNAVGGARITATSTGANVTGTLGVSGNTTVGNLIGPVANGNSNLNIPAANGNVNITAVGNATLVITGTGANITGTLNATGNANVGNIGATNGVFTNVSGNGAGLTAIAGANVTGTVANATYATSAGTATSATTAGTVTTAAQPNITSVGTLTSLTVSGTSNLGPVGNVTITGGSNGQVLTTNGSGVLSWSTVAGGGGASISNGTSNVNIATSGGNITMSVGGTANVVTVTSSNVQLGTGSGGNISGANVVTANLFISSVATGVSAAGTVQSNATALTSQITVVSTVASGAGVRLPTAIAGMRFTIVNTSANALLVYPATNGIINSQAANAAYSQPAGARLDYISTTTTQWYTLNATYG